MTFNQNNINEVVQEFREEEFLSARMTREEPNGEQI